MSASPISVVLTAYNAERYIEEALDAILAQTVPADEVIVVDDGSTDATPALLERFGGAIRVIRQDNRGHAAALNRGMSEARGEYLAKCDADDIWELNKLERQLEALREHPEIDVAFSAITIFGRLTSSLSLTAVGDHSVGILDGRRFARTLYGFNVVCPSSVLVRRSLYERIGPFAEHLAAEDYDYWFRCLAVGAVFYYDPTPLVRYRTHDGQITSNVMQMRWAGHEVRMLHADLIGDPRFARAVRTEDFFYIARLLVDEGRLEEARELFGRSVRSAPGITGSAWRALAWFLILTLPASARERTGGMMIRCSRAIDRLLGVRQPVVPQPVVPRQPVVP